MADSSTPVWRRSTRSNASGGECVELAALGGDTRGVRDSKNPGQGHLTFGRARFAAFTASVRAGRFDRH